MKKYLNSIFIFFIFLQSVASAQEVLKLDQFLEKTSTESEQYKSIDLSIKALRADIESRDLGLISSLTLEASQTDDKKDSFSNFIDRESNSKLYTLELDKKFSTGTTASLGLTREEAEQNTFATSPLYRSDWEISIRQDLWQNFFGRGSRSRETANNYELKSRQYDLLLKKQQLLSTFEEKYWDLAYFYKQHEIQKQNIKQSEQILDWTRKRYSQSAARDSDVLQAQALLASRKLDLADLENQIEKVWVQISIYQPNTPVKSWQPHIDSLSIERSIESLILTPSNQKGPPSKLEALSAQYRTQQVRAQLNTVQDETAPSLALFYTHGRNGVRDIDSESIQRAQKDQTVYNQIGFSFTLDLDRGLQKNKETAALLQAQSAELDSQRLAKQTSLEWTDLQRQLVSLKEQLRLATELAKIQKSKSTIEKRFYQQGKSTIFQAIIIEVEASEAELRVYRILNSIRKTESQARLFAEDQREG
jgi:outer membrane protein TolC